MVLKQKPGHRGRGFPAARDGVGAHSQADGALPSLRLGSMIERPVAF